MKRVQRLPKSRWLPILLVVLLLAESSSFAGSKAAPDPKAQAAALGVGHKAVVTLTDGSEVKGKITALDANSLTIDKGKSKGSSQLAYADVRRIRRDGMTGMEKATVITVTAVVVVGIGAVIAASAWSHGFCNEACPPGSSSPCTCTH